MNRNEVIAEIKQAARGRFVFSGKAPDQPLSDIKKTWASVCRKANVEGARIHDLRHTFASILVSRGASLPLIGALLGHTQVATTARYAHLYDEPLREAVDQVGFALEQWEVQNNDTAGNQPLTKSQQRN